MPKNQLLVSIAREIYQHFRRLLDRLKVKIRPRVNDYYLRLAGNEQTTNHTRLLSDSMDYYLVGLNNKCSYSVKVSTAWCHYLHFNNVAIYERMDDFNLQWNPSIIISKKGNTYALSILALLTTEIL